MRKLLYSLLLILLFAPLAFPQNAHDWLQWAGNAQHTGMISVAGQMPVASLADILYDPHVRPEMKSEFGELLVHYQTALVKGTFVFMATKSGHYSASWNTQVWGETAFEWKNQ